MKKHFALAAIAFALVPFTAAASDDPLQSELKAFVIETAEDGTETMAPRVEVEPGDLVEYQLTYTNSGDTALSGLIINAPVPAETEFVAESAMTKQTGAFEVSIDNGATWGAPPIMMPTDDGEVEISASEYDMVRWLPTAPIDAGDVWSFAYRVSVE